MKIIKGLVLFCFLGIGVSSCFNPPEFNDKPEIIFRDIYFGDSPVGSDSIVIKFDFKDGDGDLGLPKEPLFDPYHEFNFGVENGNNQVLTVPAVRPTNLNNFRVEVILTNQELINAIYSEGLKSAKTGKTPNSDKFIVYDIPPNKTLATFNSRSNGYPSLPPYSAPYSTCENTLTSYRTDTIFVLHNSKNAVKSSRIVDSLVTRTSNKVFAYAVVDTFYNEVNLRQYTIRVKFFQRVGNSYEEYDWRKEFCSTFDTKFDVLSEKESPLEGTISYAMNSVGFINIFSVKSLYLEFQIMDQAFNHSNIVRTPEFTLNDIKR